MKKYQIFTLFIVALAVSFNTQLFFPHQDNATLTLYAGQDDEEDDKKECFINGQLGEYNPCTVGNTDCTPTNCQPDEL
jgi:hypothetical protein